MTTRASAVKIRHCLFLEVRLIVLFVTFYMIKIHSLQVFMVSTNWFRTRFLWIEQFQTCVKRNVNIGIIRRIFRQLQLSLFFIMRDGVLSCDLYIVLLTGLFFFVFLLLELLHNTKVSFCLLCFFPSFEILSLLLRILECLFYRMIFCFDEKETSEMFCFPVRK